MKHIYGRLIDRFAIILLLDIYVISRVPSNILGNEMEVLLSSKTMIQMVDIAIVRFLEAPLGNETVTKKGLVFHLSLFTLTFIPLINID